MRIKKPLLSTIIFAGILLVGIVVLYFLISIALETDTNDLNNTSRNNVIKVETTA